MKEYNVYGMSCAACSQRVERAVSSLREVESCSVNLLTATMRAEGDFDDELIIKTVEKAGYSASPKNKENTENVNKTFQNTQKNAVFPRLMASIVLLIPLMYLSMGAVMLGAPLPAALATNPTAIALLQMMISALVMIINQRFFTSGFSAALRLAPNMDTLVALGSGASFAYSVGVLFTMLYESDAAVLSHSLHGLYFESAAMILTLITVGKMLEERAKGKTTSALRSLIDLSPKTARLVRDGAEVIVPVEEVKAGDVFILKPGDAVPVDGIVISGESSIIEAALTGESVPVDKSQGDKVLAATVNTSGFLRCQATSVGEDTAIAGVIRLVESASSSKAPIAKVADKVSGIFVPLVISIALLTLGIWWGVSGDFGYAVGRGISVLVISCPCALGLATPVAIMVGSGVGAKMGILFKNAEVLEHSGRIKNVLLDKTGTITKGEPEVVELLSVDEKYEGELLKIALSLEENSEHPLARAIVEYARDRVEKTEASSFEAMAGSGVSAFIDGERCYGGSLKFISEKARVSEKTIDICARLADEGKTPMLFTAGDRILGIIATSDAVRDDAADAISELRSMGLTVTMLTGDNAQTARAVGARVGVDEIISDVLPEDKARVVTELSEKGGALMVGDGINDAPALASATVGVAIGGGTDVAIDSAGIILVKNRLSDVVAAIRLGRSTLKNIYENLFWAFIYNSIGIPLAAGLLGLSLSPMFGAAAMSLSSICVVSNALRLNSFPKKYATRVAKNAKNDIINTINTKENQEGKENDMEFTMKIEGMMCPHCEGRVRDALTALEGVCEVFVSHEDGIAKVKGSVSAELLKSTVENQGYKVLSVE